MSVQVLPYTDAHAERWDAFVRVSRNGTLFHTRRFLAYHPTERFHDASLLIMHGDAVAAVLPAASVETGGERMLVAHPGASYGGLVLGMDVSVVVTGQILDAVTMHARGQGYHTLSFLRLSPASIQRASSEDQEYWLYQRGWMLERCEIDGSIDLRLWTADDVLARLTGKCRNMVRQAERSGLTVRPCEDFRSFWPILEETLAVRHGVKPTHTLAEIEHLTQLLPGSVRLMAAYKDLAVVGGIVVVTLHDQALYTLYMAQDYVHQSLHPLHLILTQVIRLCLQEHRKVLHLGVSTEDGGKEVNEGLLFFKESFGMRPVNRESWSLEL